MLSHSFKFVVIGLLFSGMMMTGYVYSHGLIENPPSREYFCGKITRPEHSESGAVVPYEECRGVLTKDGNYNNDLYQFMSVLSHSRGYYQNANLPLNVCGYDSETFKGGASPWDALINWPTNKISAGPKEFVWDISYGPHFSDTEHFVYWITKPSFHFDQNTPLKWSDIEIEPFCEIPWDDTAPNKNKDSIWADVPNAKFHMVCNVPQREGRHVIYAEWGRTKSTDERFHSCIDVTFSEQAQGNQIEARIAPVAVKEFSGEGILELNGSESVGDNLNYEWVVESQNPESYSLTNATTPNATLHMKNPAAEQNVTIALHVSNAEGNSNAEVKLLHMPERTSEWMDLGKLTHEPQTLKVGDELSIRAVQNDGKDVYYPSQPLILTEKTIAPDQWPYALAEAVNHSDSPIMLGVINEGEASNAPHPVMHATDNKIYVKAKSPIKNAYLQIKTESVETPPSSSVCKVTLQNGNSEWWAGLDVGTDLPQVKLDFSKTGIDLAKVTLDPGVFKANITGQVIHITQKPDWVNANTPGYIGMNGNNYSVLKHFELPTCSAAE